MRSNDLKNVHAPHEILDLIGIGFGPANLAVALVMAEQAEAGTGPRPKCAFLERRSTFAWHPGLMIEGARVQLSFMKDLVTLRNPRSRYTFLNYLKEKGRLDYFANLRNFSPTRVEFNDYYSWVAQDLERYARYGREVVDVRAGASDGPVRHVVVTTQDIQTKKVEEWRARNLVVATGGVPRTPPGVEITTSRRVFHAHHTLQRVPGAFPDRNAPYRFVVVGSGQSAAEVFQYLYENYPRASVVAALRRFAYKPADDSHFVNEIFFPEMVDYLYSISAKKRQKVLEMHRDTNYSCVDLDLIKEIYEKIYQNRIVGDTKVEIRPFLELKAAIDREDCTVLQFRHRVSEEVVALEADGVVLATGYERAKTHPLLKGLEPHLLHDDEGCYQVQRDYQVKTQETFLPKVYIQGFSERTHGLSDTLLSVLPIRSMEIYESLFLEGSAEEALETAS
jgi:L-ornithine N5-oxygenase